MKFIYSLARFGLSASGSFYKDLKNYIINTNYPPGTGPPNAGLPFQILVDIDFQVQNFYLYLANFGFSAVRDLISMFVDRYSRLAPLESIVTKITYLIEAVLRIIKIFSDFNNYLASEEALGDIIPGSLNSVQIGYYKSMLENSLKLVRALIKADGGSLGKTIEKVLRASFSILDLVEDIFIVILSDNVIFG